MVFELAALYQKTGKEQPFQDLTHQVLNNTNIPPQAYLKVAEISAVAPPHLPLMIEAFQRYLKREPSNPRIWLELACVQLAAGQPDPAFQSLRQAVTLGGEPIKDAARKEPRFGTIRNSEAFQKLTAPAKQNFPPGFGGFIP